MKLPWSLVPNETNAYSLPLSFDEELEATQMGKGRAYSNRDARSSIVETDMDILIPRSFLRTGASLLSLVQLLSCSLAQLTQAKAHTFINK